MTDINIQQMYNGIVTRGRRNAPTYNEVRREAALISQRAYDPTALARI